MTPDRIFEILLVEDNPMDIQLAREALREVGISHRLQVVFDGEQAIARLQTLKKSGGVLPDLVLLDLNMPRSSGRDVLAFVKQDPHLCAIPVLILSTSREERDIVDCYRLHANSYMVKPLDFGSFINLMRSTCDYWLVQAALPSAIPGRQSRLAEVPITAVGSQTTMP